MHGDRQEAGLSELGAVKDTMQGNIEHDIDQSIRLYTHHLLALSASQFHSRLKTHLFQQSFPI